MQDGFHIDNQDGERARWWHAATLALTLVFLFFVLSSLGERHPVISSDGTQDPITLITTGDWEVKTVLYISTLPSKSTAGVPGTLTLHKALKSYEQAAAQGSASAIRRIGVLSYELKEPEPINVFSRLTSPKVLKGRPAQDVMELRREAAMWRDVYTGSITPANAKAYADRISQLNLGPMKGYALKHLYTRAGEKRLADEAMQTARLKAAASVIPGTILMFVLIFAGLVGVGLIILFFKRRTPPAVVVHSEDEPEIPRRAELRRAQMYFYAFTFYMGLFLVLSLAAGSVFEPVLSHLSPEQRLIRETALEFGLSAMTGLMALSVLVILIRRAGGQPADIGLLTRDLGKNIAWGVGGYCALLPILLASAFISNAVFRGFKTPEHPIVPMLFAGDSLVFIMLFLTGTALAPFFEEIFFRGVLYRGLRAGMSFAAAVIVSAAAFAIVHPQLPAGFLPIFALGAVFAVLAETRRSLVPSMVAHALNNGIIFLLMFFLFSS